ncbi:MAG: polyprenyl synthetase family protein [Polyangiales bacterium]
MVEGRNGVLKRLGEICAREGVRRGELSQLLESVESDLAAIDKTLDQMLDPMAGRNDNNNLALTCGAHSPLANPVHRSVCHLLSLKGKRLRPICVSLAARVGSGWNRSAQALAVAVELTHNATLLHDDVVDLGETRRGSVAARAIYGNAASIFAGNWLLIEALSLIHDAQVPDVFQRMLEVVKQMIEAESLQLQWRGRIPTTTEDYFRIVEGKTASLFRWALGAGGRAGMLSVEACDALERYGQSLGVAFQLVDDVLDLIGNADAIGKSIFADVREGKITYPILLGVERDPALRTIIEDACLKSAMRDRDRADSVGAVSRGDESLNQAMERRVQRALRDTGAIADSMTLARRIAENAVECLAAIEPSAAKDALADIALTVSQRSV